MPASLRTRTGRIPLLLLQGGLVTRRFIRHGAWRRFGRFGGNVSQRRDDGRRFGPRRDHGRRRALRLDGAYPGIGYGNFSGADRRPRVLLQLGIDDIRREHAKPEGDREDSNDSFHGLNPRAPGREGERV